MVEKSPKFDFKPSDMIEWVYEYDNKPIMRKEFRSRIGYKRVVIDRELVHMCISVEDNVYSWLNEKGLFYAHADDVVENHAYFRVDNVLPRVFVGR